jgi:hypothetical protein
VKNPSPALQFTDQDRGNPVAALAVVVLLYSDDLALYVASERHPVFTLRRTPRRTQHRIGNRASMNPSVSRVACGRLRPRGVLGRADVLGRLPTRHAGSAYLTAGNGANGKNGDDHNDDNQDPAGNPPADWRLLVLEFLIVRVRAAVVGIVCDWPYMGPAWAP